MPSERTVVLVVALLAMAMLTAGAANLADPATLDGGDGGIGGGLPGGGDDDSDPTDEVTPQPVEEGGPIAMDLCVEPAYGWDLQLTVMLVLLLLGGLIWWRSNVLAAIGIVVGLSPMVVLMFLVLTRDCEPEDRAGLGFGSGEGLGQEAAQVANESAGTATEVATNPLLLLVTLLALGAAAIALVAYSDGFGTDGTPFDDEDETDETRPREIGRIAGETADRLAAEDVADTGVENEVYRAWVEMTRRLDVASPETSTPGEFASAAVDAGLDPADVDALTDLFEEVRYGDRPVTTDREHAAVDVLRRIERTYTDEP